MSRWIRRAWSLSLVCAIHAGCEAPTPQPVDGGPPAADARSDLDAGGEASDAGVDPDAAPRRDASRLDAGAGCGDLASFTGTPRLTLVEGPMECGSPDAAEVECGVFRARIERAEGTPGPLDDPSLDEGMPASNVLLTVRVRGGVDPCGGARWVVFESGGPGRGYGPTFGGVEPGHYEPDGAGYGDDLIRWYNDLGFVTVDVHWTCATDACERRHAGWVPRAGRDGGQGWYGNTAGLGYVGTASRAHAIYEWAHTMAGRRVCAHAHSGGSGRGVTVLTRYGGDELISAMVFDGGPVFAYVPWYCDLSDGPLGPQPDRFAIRACDRRGEDANPSNDDCASSNAAIYDCARTPGDNSSECSYDRCRTGRFDAEAMLADSSFLRASRRTFDSTAIGVVLGGQDVSPAPAHARLWLSGYEYDGTRIPGLASDRLVLRQGLCERSSDTYPASSGPRPCTDWDPTGFASVDEDGLGFDRRLMGAGHDTTRSRGGARVVQEVMLSLCEP